MSRKINTINGNGGVCPPLSFPEAPYKQPSGKFYTTAGELLEAPPRYRQVGGNEEKNRQMGLQRQNKNVMSDFKSYTKYIFHVMMQI